MRMIDALVSPVRAAWARIDARLLPDWRSWHRAWSMRIAAIAAVAISYLSYAPDALNAALNAVPHDLRATLPAWIGPAVFAVLFFARFWDQSKGKRGG